MEPLTQEFTVACPPEHAFAVWAERTSMWWPATHSVSGAPEAVVIEPRAGGRIYERAPGGAEHEWGRVTAYEPPRRLAYTWHLRQDAADATDVEITFSPAPRDRRGDRPQRLGAARRARARTCASATPAGWAGLLPHYLAAAQGGDGGV